MNREFRPSALPKLAECPCYQAPAAVTGYNGSPSAEAARGTAMDHAFRDRIMGEAQSDMLLPKLSQEDEDAVDWAVKMALEISPNIRADEDSCRLGFECDVFEYEGTADGISIKDRVLVDLKSGMVRDYKAQMAAYALALMDEHYAREWDCYLLFADARTVKRLSFTYAEALFAVKKIWERWSSPSKRPMVCDYCQWCARQEVCVARREAMDAALSVAQPTFDLGVVLADPEKLGRFLTACRVVEDFQAKAKDAAKARIEAGETIPGWGLRTRKGSEWISAKDLLEAGATPEQLAEAVGNVSAKKAFDMWELGGVQAPFPHGRLQAGASTTYLTRDKTQN